MLWNILFVCLMVTGTLSASSKRDDYSSSGGGSGSSGSSSVSFPSSSYSGSGSSASGYASGSSSYGSGSPTYTSGSSGYASGSSGYGTGSSSYSSGSKPYVSGASATGYSGSASSTSGVSSQPASQGNLYYYYYPVQPKPQDGSNYADSSSSQSASYSSGSDNYETNANSAFGNQVGSPNAGDYEAQGSSYNGAVSPLDTANYAAGSLGGLPSYGGAGFASSLLGGTGYAAAGSAPAGFAAAPSIAYAPSGYGGGLGSYGSQYGSYPGYGQAPSEYNGGKRFGLSSLIMPMLALAGLGLLIPTVTSLGSRTKKTKRSVNDPTSFASVGERMDRYLAIYRSAVENEECVSRIICELGNTMKDVGGKSMILSVLEKVVPMWMKHKMGVFKNAVLSSDSGKCRKYKC